MMDQLYISTVMQLLMITLVPTLLLMRIVMVMPPMENTGLPFLMAEPKLLHTQLEMLIQAMLLM